ncbi:hypothetical protein GCM10010341_52400 [Streptomyces noursei]|nr:hypothetical protein GCM10010341_52400 [Streptomyces noursei]
MAAVVLRALVAGIGIRLPGLTAAPCATRARRAEEEADHQDGDEGEGDEPEHSHDETGARQEQHEQQDEEDRGHRDPPPDRLVPYLATIMRFRGRHLSGPDPRPGHASVPGQRRSVTFRGADGGGP